MMGKPGSKMLAIALAFLAGVLLYSLIDILVKPRAYWGVTPRVIEQVDGKLIVVADFTKGHCTLVLFSAQGVGFDGVDVLDYHDFDGRGTAPGEQEDRLAGDSTIRVSVELGGMDYDAVELRTRHICEGAKVDKLFLRIDL